MHKGGSVERFETPSGGGESPHEACRRFLPASSVARRGGTCPAPASFLGGMRKGGSTAFGNLFQRRSGSVEVGVSDEVTGYRSRFTNRFRRRRF